MAFGIPSSETVGRLPWFVRFVLGCFMASGAVALTNTIPPLRAFPLLLTFPAVVLAAWYLGMWGAVGCALLDAVLVDRFLTVARFRLSALYTPEEVRLAMFILVTLLLGWSVRRLSQQKAELAHQELRRQLELVESERRLAQERAAASEQLRYRDIVLQLALKASGMGLWVWDLETDNVHRADEVFQMLGREPGAVDSKPEGWLEFVHPDDVSTLREAFLKVRSEGTDYRVEYRVIWPDGSVHWLESQGRCQRDAQGKPVCVFGLLTDVTHRKKAEDSLVRAEKLAVAGKLAASVAHEINNPLEAVANMLYLITISDSPDEARRQASSALDELMRISLVAQSTLKFHKETGRPKIVLLSDVMDSVLAMFRAKLQALQIRVDVKTDREVPIACMPSEAQQIFANVVANAIEALQDAGRIAIRIRPSRDWRNRAVRGMRVTVCDSGIGIDRPTLSHIFEPFFTTKPGTGTGLGLWVVAQLVERHKGDVHVWSSQQRERSGTAFSIFLPFVEVREKRDTDESAKPATGSRRELAASDAPEFFFKYQHQRV